MIPTTHPSARTGQAQCVDAESVTYAWMTLYQPTIGWDAV